MGTQTGQNHSSTGTSLRGGLRHSMWYLDKIRGKKKNKNQTTCSLQREESLLPLSTRYIKACIFLSLKLWSMHQLLLISRKTMPPDSYIRVFNSKRYFYHFRLKKSSEKWVFFPRCVVFCLPFEPRLWEMCRAKTDGGKEKGNKYWGAGKTSNQETSASCKPS